MKEMQGSEREKTKFVWPSRITRLVSEFFIVFLGVYLAFLFSDYQEEMKNREVRAKYYATLIFEFRYFSKHLEQENIKLETYIELLEEIDQGKQPDLIAPDLYYLYSGLVVKAAFDGENFESLDEDILQSIIRGSLLLEALKNKIARFNQKLHVILLPAQASPDNNFYDERGNLKAYLSWYPQLIQEIYETNRLLDATVNERAIPSMELVKKGLQQKTFWDFW